MGSGLVRGGGLASVGSPAADLPHLVVQGPPVTERLVGKLAVRPQGRPVVNGGRGRSGIGRIRARLSGLGWCGVGLRCRHGQRHGRDETRGRCVETEHDFLAAASWPGRAEATKNCARSRRFASEPHGDPARRRSGEEDSRWAFRPVERETRDPGPDRRRQHAWRELRQGQRPITGRQRRSGAAGCASTALELAELGQFFHRRAIRRGINRAVLRCSGVVRHGLVLRWQLRERSCHPLVARSASDHGRRRVTLQRQGRNEQPQNEGSQNSRH